MEKDIRSVSVPARGASRRSQTRLSVIHAREKDTTRMHALAQEEVSTNQKGRARETAVKEIGAKEEKEIGKAERDMEEKEKDMGAKDMAAKAMGIKADISMGNSPALHHSRTNGARQVGMHGGPGPARVGQEAAQQHHG